MNYVYSQYQIQLHELLKFRAYEIYIYIYSLQIEVL